MRITINFVAFFIGFMGNAVSFAISFDCNKAAMPTEKAICGNNELSALDDQLLQSYKNALARTDDPGALKASQRAWLSQQRNLCRQDIACLQQVYTVRLAALNKLAASPAPTGVTGEDKESTQPLPAKGKARPITKAVVDNASLETSEGLIKFKHGKYTQGKIEDGEVIDASIGDTAFGDLNGDGVNDAAVITAVNTGGSGVFVSLCALLGTPGQPRSTEAVFLGDRSDIKSIKIESGKVILNILAPGRDDASCCPSLKKHLIYSLKNGKLVEHQNWTPYTY